MTYVVVGGILIVAAFMIWRNIKNNLKGKCSCDSCGPEAKKMCSSAIKESKEDKKS